MLAEPAPETVQSGHPKEQEAIGPAAAVDPMVVDSNEDDGSIFVPDEHLGMTEVCPLKSLFDTHLTCTMPSQPTSTSDAPRRSTRERRAPREYWDLESAKGAYTDEEVDAMTDAQLAQQVKALLGESDGKNGHLLPIRALHHFSLACS